MTDERRKLARELLAAATPRPWKWLPDDYGEYAFLHNDADDPVIGISPHCGDPTKSDAALIAAAPELLREALDELDRREREDRDMASRLDEAGL